MCSSSWSKRPWSRLWAVVCVVESLRGLPACQHLVHAVLQPPTGRPLRPDTGSRFAPCPSPERAFPSATARHSPSTNQLFPYLGGLASRARPWGRKPFTHKPGRGDLFLLQLLGGDHREGGALFPWFGSGRRRGGGPTARSPPPGLTRAEAAFTGPKCSHHIGDVPFFRQLRPHALSQSGSSGHSSRRSKTFTSFATGKSFSASSWAKSLPIWSLSCKMYTVFPVK